uniref:Receptor ligand binding region domain-containing protein n=2 Tax=Biomphalaria glabrata TaxID=6526 RepID=A0A2C9KXE5_BIOGL
MSWFGPVLVLTLWTTRLSLVHTRPQVTENILNICLIVPGNNDRMFSLTKVFPGVLLAVDKVKFQLLSGMEVKVRVADSKCSPVYGPINAINFYRNNEVSVFIGPVCDYSLAPVARYASVWDLPVISPGGFAHDLSQKHGNGAEYTTLTRIGVTFNSLAEFMVDYVIDSLNWTRGYILFDVDGMSDVMPKFCYLAAASMFNRTKAHNFRFEHDSFKPEELNYDQKLRTGPKQEFASECLL